MLANVTIFGEAAAVVVRGTDFYKEIVAMTQAFPPMGRRPIYGCRHGIADSRYMVVARHRRRPIYGCRTASPTAMSPAEADIKGPWHC